MKTKITAFAVVTATALLFNARADITTGLVGYWTFDEGSGSSTAADTSGNSNTGTLTGFADGGFTTMWTTDSWLNNAIVFNQGTETTDYVSVPNSSSLGSITNNAKFTIAAWVKMNGAPGSTGAAILCKGTGGGGESYCLDVYNSKFRCFHRNASGTTEAVNSTLNPSQNTWYHVVVTMDKNTTPRMVMYINGTKNTDSGTASLTTILYSTHAVTIGNRESSASSGYNIPFKGVIDQVRIYNRGLTASDAFELYTNSAPLPVITTQPRSVTCYSNDTAVFTAAASASARNLQPLGYQWRLNGVNISGATTTLLTLPNVTVANAGTYTMAVTNYGGTTISDAAVLTVQPLPAVDFSSGLVGWWKFDDASGSSTAADSTVNNNAGALTGFTDTGFTAMWCSGMVGGALSFNGDASTLNVVAVPGVGSPAPSILDFSASPVFTLSAWVNGATVQTGGAAIIAKGTGNGGEQYIVDVYGNKFRFFVRDASGATYGVNSSVLISGSWQHVAAVLNGVNGTMSLYVNGALVGSVVAPSSLLANSHEVSIGNRQSGTTDYNYPFTGIIDDVRIYSRDLTSADVLALYGQDAYPIIGTQYPVPHTNIFKVFAGSSPTFKLASVLGLGLSYHWYTNGIADQTGTNATYQLHNLPVGATISNYCIVANSKGSATSSVWTATVVAKPTAPYPLAVLADHPVGYWRLNETPDDGAGNIGVLAVDYRGGNNGTNLNTILGLGGYHPTTDPTETSAQFGHLPSFPGSNNVVTAIEGGIDFSTPSNGSFSVEVWVKPDMIQSNGNGGIVAKGSWGNEQFDLDLGGTGYSYRFAARDAGNGLRTTSSNTNVPDGNWHHVVAVMDQANSNMCLYVDGIRVSSTVCPPSAGVVSTLAPTSIGARLGGAGNYSQQQFFGNINDVAVYNYALSSNQVVNHYSALGVPPTITQDLQAQMYAFAGFPLVLSVIASSASPMTYQWQRNGVNLVDGGGISGSHSNTLSLGIADFSQSGSTYRVFITNQATSTPTISTLATLTVLPRLGFNGFGNGWTSQGSPATVPRYTSANVLRLTDGTKNEGASSFFSYPVYVGAFQASFTYQDVGGGGADGMAFVMHNDSRGAAALGAIGGSLGYNGITNSAAVEFNIYSGGGNTVGYAFRTNGATGSPYTSTSPVNIASGDPIGVTLLYLNGTLSLTLTDAVAQTSFSVTTNVDIPAAVGATTAFVGFTGADGGTASTQTVADFTFDSLPVVVLQPADATHVTLSWPDTVGGGYVLKQCASLGSGWTNVSTPAIRGGGFYQVTLSLGTGSTFYQLVNAQ